MAVADRVGVYRLIVVKEEQDREEERRGESRCWRAKTRVGCEFVFVRVCCCCNGGGGGGGFARV